MKTLNSFFKRFSITTGIEIDRKGDWCCVIRLPFIQKETAEGILAEFEQILKQKG